LSHSVLFKWARLLWDPSESLSCFRFRVKCIFCVFPSFSHSYVCMDR